MLDRNLEYRKYMISIPKSIIGSIYNFAELDLPTTGRPWRDRTRPYIIFNMVASVDGKTTTNGSGLEGLGSVSDRQLMNKLRSQVDGVLVGGNTLRVDPFIPTVSSELVSERLKNFATPQPLGIVVSRRGDLPLDHRFWQAGKELRLVLVGADISQAKLAELEARSQVRKFSPNAEGDLNLGEMMTLLYSEFGIKRLLIEAGASFNYALIDQNCADEFFITISPHLVGGKKNSTVLGGEGNGFDQLRNLQLKSCYMAEDHLYLRYQFQA
jgi:2,5-diamino-6-(ribosylamino)-4(3H)-pyrimidinone 5'-phosphate reductase